MIRQLSIRAALTLALVAIPASSAQAANTYTGATTVNSGVLLAAPTGDDSAMLSPGRVRISTSSGVNACC